MKNIIRNFVQNISRTTKSRLRRKRALFVVHLDENKFNASLWQNRNCLWQEEKDYEHFDQLEDSLRLLLLAHDVEENIDTLIIPASTMLHEEELSMPFLTAHELRQAMAWEAQNCVSEDEICYCYTCETTINDKQQIVKLFIMSADFVYELQKLCKNLFLRLRGICTQGTSDVVAAWFTGDNLVCIAKKRKTIAVQQILSGCDKYLPRVACTLFILSALTYGGAWGGCLLAQQQLQDTEKELADLKIWQERQQFSRIAENKIKKIENILAQTQPKKFISKDLENLGRLIVPGCWLVNLERNLKTQQLDVQGRAVDNLALQTFVDALQEAKIYKKVELLQTKQEKYLEYSLRLQLAEEVNQ